MNRFEIITPTDLGHATKLLAEGGRAALAGGVDVVDLLKQRLVEPAALVNLKGLRELEGIESRSDGGMRIGALVRLDQVAAHRAVRERFTALAEAAAETATPQIRNAGTVGGNLLQRPRCWYFRNSQVQCLKKGGSVCYSVGGLNRYNAILGGGPSFIVHPSSLATALVAFDASVTIAGPKGRRSVALEKFFTLPEVDPRRENQLEAGEILVEVELPPRPGINSVYLEAREKQSFDWPLVSVAAAIAMDAGGRQVREARLVIGAVAPIPWRVPQAEKMLRGVTLSRQSASAAAAEALKDAQPMSDNGYKVAIAKALVRRAILRAGGIQAAY